MGFGTEIRHYLGVPARKPRIGKKQVYNVTQLGIIKHEQEALDGVHASVLDYVAENSPCTVQEVERAKGLDRGKAARVLSSLCRDGYVVRGAQDD
jgi:DNA-binding MarR family transcriptional regulator